MAERTIRKGSVSFRVAVPPERWFWDVFETPDWEPCTVAIFEQLLGPGVRYLDLGAFIGPTALYAAALGCEVVALEPDPPMFAELQQNVVLNPELAGRIRLLPVALALTDGGLDLHVGIDSRASLLGEGETVRVPTMTPETLVREVGAVDFVKIDVEGAEYLFMPRLVAALAARPAIYLSTHPGLIVDRSTALTTVRTAPHAFALNRRLLQSLRPYTSHRVYDDAGGYREIRNRNLLRLAFPFAGRSAFLVDNCLFTN